MAISDELKRRKMDAISHPETRAHMRLLGVNRPNSTMPPVAGIIPKGMKQLAMSAISSVETLAQVGWIRKAGAIAVYAARIREVDRETQRKPPTRHPVRSSLPPGRDLGRE